MKNTGSLLLTWRESDCGNNGCVLVWWRRNLRQPMKNLVKAAWFRMLGCTTHSHKHAMCQLVLLAFNSFSIQQNDLKAETPPSNLLQRVNSCIRLYARECVYVYVCMCVCMCMCVRIYSAISVLTENGTMHRKSLNCVDCHIVSGVFTCAYLKKTFNLPHPSHWIVSLSTLSYLSTLFLLPIAARFGLCVNPACGKRNQ